MSSIRYLVRDFQLSASEPFILGFPFCLLRMAPFIHPRAAERTKLCSSHNRPAPEAVTSARADVRPTGAHAFRHFSDTAPHLCPFFAGFPRSAVARYPPGTGSAQILRSISPNSRRVRCPSASKSQYYRACFTSRPPVYRSSRVWSAPRVNAMSTSTTSSRRCCGRHVRWSPRLSTSRRCRITR